MTTILLLILSVLAWLLPLAWAGLAFYPLVAPYLSAKANGRGAKIERLLGLTRSPESDVNQRYER